MRFIALGALSVCCALVGCAHNESSPSASAPLQPAEQRRSMQGSDAGDGGTGATAPSSAQTSSPVPADRSGSKTTPGSGNASSTSSRSTSSGKGTSSQGMTSTKPKPAPTGGNGGNQTGSVSAAGAPKTDASKSEAPKPEAAKPEAPRSGASSAAPGPAKASPAAPAAASLDLTSLEQRLKETRAIGVFSKLSLKNQVDDLLGQFKAFHNRRSSTPLSELRQRYDLLLLKLLSLLQDGDPPLASAISSSREAIWGILADPQKFARL